MQGQASCLRHSGCLLLALASACLYAGGLVTACAPPPTDGALSWGGQTRAPTVSSIDARDLGGFAGSGGSGGSPGFDARPDLAATFDVPAAAAPDVRTPPDLRAYESGVAGCHVDIDVTPDSLNLDYSPNHIEAIWINTGAGKFIKSVGVWANRRISHLPKWIAATTAAGVRQNRVDAVTGATQYQYVRQTVVWNCTGVDKQRVADGPYRVCFELNETNGDSEYDCVNFNKGPMPETTKPPDTSSFRYRTINFFP
ncbi:MAG TPA: DUF2271 domain-containing protein [Polyangia bacterium]|jgi:hypothetical protein|nr:DUF2271 domain-containing protein [Polyangia bacterium]